MQLHMWHADWWADEFDFLFFFSQFDDDHFAEQRIGYLGVGTIILSTECYGGECEGAESALSF